MNGSDWMFFILTFLTGFVIGLFLYITAFKPTYVPEDFADLDKASEFSVIGSVYGGLRGPEFTRPSFRVISDQTYQYRPGGETGAATVAEGRMVSSLFDALRTAADEDDVAYFSESVARANCASDRGGYDYHYTITIDGTVYELDTCQTNLEPDDELALVLDDVWTYVADPTAYTATPSDSLNGVIVDYLRKHLSPFTE